MRSALLITALIGAATLYACDDAAAPTPNPPVASAGLPEGFQYAETPSDYGELDVGGRFIVENRTGQALQARLAFADWGARFEEVDGETLELVLPARGRVSTRTIAERARAVSMRLSGTGVLSQSHSRFEHLGVRVVITRDGSSPLHLDADVFVPTPDDQLAASPGFETNPDDPDTPGTFRFGNFFRVVNETGFTLPLELAFKRAKDDDVPAITLPIVIAAHGVQTWNPNERYGWVSVTKPGRPMSADTPVRSTITTGDIRLRPNRVIEYRISDNGDRGTVLDLAE